MEKNISTKVELKNYYFSGLEASQIGALKSVLNYYDIPTSSSWIYGMTGMAFLLVHNQDFKKENAGPPESEIFKLARNIGLNIEGIHTYAEDERFKELQKEMWSKARDAINKGYPVFAKNIDLENQTSVVYGYDSVGYYTHSWHSGNGHENAGDVIPWNNLGQSLCPCGYCKKNKEKANNHLDAKGVVSLHWAIPIPAADHLLALKEALEFVIRFNDQGVIHWYNEKYLVGELAYKEWISALEQNKIDKFHFSLTLEPIADARSHALSFLNEIKDSINGLPLSLIDEALVVYKKVVDIYKFLVQKFPYEQPREYINDIDKNECTKLIKELKQYEEQAYEIIRKIYKEIKTTV
jgi:hypothetical protein